MKRKDRFIVCDSKYYLFGDTWYVAIQKNGFFIAGFTGKNKTEVERLANEQANKWSSKR